MTNRGRAKLGQFVPGTARHPIQHGTIGGYRAHYRHGEPMCEPCRAAIASYKRGWADTRRRRTAS